MKIDKQEKLIPKLRFKEFKEEWMSERLSTYLSFKNGLNAPKGSYGTGYKFINVLDIINNPHITYNTILQEVTVSQKAFNENIVEYGDILFQRSSETPEEVGQTNVYLDQEQPATFGGFVIRGKRIKEYDPLYFNYLLKTQHARREIVLRGSGSTHFNIGQDSLREVPIYISNDIKEQQKISSFLSLIDKKIELLNKKKELLEIYKKGIMHNIFNRDIRFKDSNGNDYPEWEEKRLEEILEERNEFAKQNDGYEHLSLSKMGVTQKTDQYNRDFLVKDKEKKYKITKLNDICYNPANLKFGVICMNRYGKGIFSPIYITYNIKEGNADFISNLVTQNSFIKKARRFEEGTVYERQAVNPSDFVKVKIAMPILEEQRSIAQFYQDLNSKTQLLKEKLLSITNFKRGLLQKMFI